MREVGPLQTRISSIIVNATRIRVPLAWRRVRLALPGHPGAHGKPQEVSRWVLDSFLQSPHRDLRPEETKALYVDAVPRWRSRTGKSENHPDFADFLKQDEYFHALRVKFGYAITCHKAQGGTWRTAFVDFSGFSGSDSAMYFRWVYTALTRAAKRLYLLNEGGFEAWDKLQVFAPAAVGSPLAVPLPPAVRAAQTEAFAELSDLETQLGMAARPQPMRGLLRRVAGQLGPLGIDVINVKADQYKETYFLRRGDETGAVSVDYGKDQLFRQARAGGIASPLTTEAVACLAAPPLEAAEFYEPAFDEQTPAGLRSFYEQFAARAAVLDLSIVYIETGRPYVHTYTLQDEHGRSVLEVWCNQKGRLTKAHLVKHSAPETVTKLHQVLTTFQK